MPKQQVCVLTKQKVSEDSHHSSTTELSLMMEVFCICAIQEGTH